MGCRDDPIVWDVFEGAEFEWLEEPLSVFACEEDWKRLAEGVSVPLAGGENIAGFDEFEGAIERGHLRVFQPDVMKWGGFTGCVEVARRVLERGYRYCPHYLGGGIGLVASAELLAAVGGDGVLEVDVNDNRLREAFPLVEESLRDGFWYCGEGVGLGIEAFPEELGDYVTCRVELRE